MMVYIYGVSTTLATEGCCLRVLGALPGVILTFGKGDGVLCVQDYDIMSLPIKRAPLSILA